MFLALWTILADYGGGGSGGSGGSGGGYGGGGGYSAGYWVIVGVIALVVVAAVIGLVKWFRSRRSSRAVPASESRRSDRAA
jgi:uncharacterized membrane protein